MAIDDGAEGEFFGIDDHVFYFLAFPGVGHVDEAVSGLDDGGVAVLAGLVFKDVGGLPGGAVFGGGEVERGAFAAPFAWGAGDVIVDDEVGAVGEGDGVGAAVVVGEGAEGDISPGFAAVVTADLKHAVLPGAAEGEQFVAAQEEDAGLDGLDLFAIVQRRGALPGFAEVAGALEVSGPSFLFFFAGGLGFLAGGAEDAAVWELDGFVFDGAEDAFWQAMRVCPSLTTVGGGGEHAPPGLGGGPCFVKQHQGAVFWLEQDGVPGGVADDGAIAEGVLDAVGDLDARGPLACNLARDPDADIGIFFVGATEPGGDEAGGGFGECASVNLRVGAGVVNELGCHDWAGWGGEGSGEGKDAEEERFHGEMVALARGGCGGASALLWHSRWGWKSSRGGCRFATWVADS